MMSASPPLADEHTVSEQPGVGSSALFVFVVTTDHNRHGEEVRGLFTDESEARKRMEGPPPERGPEKVPAGMLLGVLQWHAAHGEVKRIVVRQGARANQIRVPGCRRDHGFDWLLRQLRGKLSTPRRI